MQRWLACSRQVAAGVAALPAPLRDGALASVLAHQAREGGFRGRAGAADDWYTDFALRVLALTGGAMEERRRAATWLSGQPAPAEAVAAANRIHAVALLDQAGITATAGFATCTERLAACTGAPTSRTTHLFLATTALALLGHRPGSALSAILRARQCRDGGFTELPAEQPQTAATAAGAALALGAARLPRSAADAALAWLAARQTADGGLAAHAGAGGGDLLSTAVGAWTLALGGRLDALRLGDLGRFVRACRCDDGGFGAVAGDPEGDPEYTWYGLVALGLLSAQAGRRGTPPSGALPGKVGLLLRALAGASFTARP